MAIKDRSFELIKDEVLGASTPDEVALYRTAIEQEIANKMIDAFLSSRTVIDEHADDRYECVTRRDVVQPRFGDYVFPVTKRDVMRYITDQNYSSEYAEVLWEHLLFPERDVNHYFETRQLRLVHESHGDIHPIQLLEYERSLDKRGGMHAYIEPETAVIDLVSVKSCLMWLDDREPSYDDMLRQRLSTEDRVLWAKFVEFVEARMGKELPVNLEHFAYYDSASDYYLWLEYGRLALQNLDSQIHSGDRKKANDTERVALEYAAPITRAQICEGVWYEPDPNELEYNLRTGQFVNIDMLWEAAEVSEQSLGQGSYVFFRIARILCEESVDFFMPEDYLDRGAKNVWNDSWKKSHLLIEVAEVLKIFQDMETGIKIPGFGKKARILIRRVLSDLDIIYFDQQEISFLRVGGRDPADETEINYDDPDLLQDGFDAANAG